MIIQEWSHLSIWWNVMSAHIWKHRICPNQNGGLFTIPRWRRSGSEAWKWNWSMVCCYLNSNWPVVISTCEIRQTEAVLEVLQSENFKKHGLKSMIGWPLTKLVRKSPQINILQHKLLWRNETAQYLQTNNVIYFWSQLIEYLNLFTPFAVVCVLLHCSPFAIEYTTHIVKDLHKHVLPLYISIFQATWKSLLTMALLLSLNTIRKHPK